MADPNPNPKQRAEDYRSSVDDASSPKTEPGKSTRTPEQWRDLISQRIEEAMQQGAFDNLPGKGKPLNAAPDPYVSPDMQMANSLLKNNDLVPAWISDRKTVLDAIERLRARIGRGCAAAREEMERATTPQRREQVLQAWSRQVASWQQEVTELNRRIEVQNLKQPVTFLEILKLQLADELRRAGAPSVED